MLNPIESIASVGWDRIDIVISFGTQILKLDQTKRCQFPVIHIRFKSDFASIRRQVVTLLESETNSLRGPQLGKHLLAVMLHQLTSGLVQNVFAFRQRNEQR